MVQVKKASFITCDPAMLQLLRHLDKTRRIGYKFIVKQLDDQHLIVDRESVPALKTQVDAHMDQLSPDQS
ncbi:General transcription and DNA repair factor IIH subunit TFB5 [Aphelenchoides besseyi]|nr:General transcription and DNA repair factor IIH subunit TFB5 [Aphelenchoides besseyi]KAI6229567.1 General transcription and DNA repair factor IIH subunit TFB5 [Aphelenchoides besseyi]